MVCRRFPVADWKTVADEGFPPCDGNTSFIGINSAGYACCFNAVQGGTCVMETAEGAYRQMSDLRDWRLLDRPARGDGLAVKRATAELAEMRQHGSTDDIVEAAAHLERVKHGIGVRVDGCTRSHPHENMNEECERLTVVARDVSVAERARRHVQEVFRLNTPDGVALPADQQTKDAK
jgi:hypothetical protein